MSSEDTQRLSADGAEAAEASTSSHPYSPRPRLFDNDIIRAPPRDDLQASDILTDQDYRKLRSATFTKAIVPGVVSAGVISYFAPSIVTRLRPPGPQNPGKLRTGVFILALSGVMSYLSYSTVSTTVRDARREAANRNMPRDQEGNILIADRRAVEDRYSPNTPSAAADDVPENPLAKELDALGRERHRTRYTKGKGLVGEVEEEGEMRDTWLRPGVPRKDG